MNINTKAILVRLAISMPSNGRQDKDLTAQVLADEGMKEKAGKWVKNLYPPDAFAPFVKVQGKARTFHYENSLPWGDNGDRILPVSNHMDYMDGLRKITREFDDLVNVYVPANYQKWVEWARVAHGAKFDPSLYPGVDSIKSKFRFKVEVNPVPSGADFRVTLGEDEIAEMRSDLERRIQEATDGARKDLWQRLIKPITHMADTLKKADAKFKDSLVENIKDIINLIPVLNLTGDKDLQAFAKEIGETVARKNPETLRENAKTRAETAKQAEEIAKRMQAYI